MELTFRFSIFLVMPLMITGACINPPGKYLWYYVAIAVISWLIAFTGDNLARRIILFITLSALLYSTPARNNFNIVIDVLFLLIIAFAWHLSFIYLPKMNKEDEDSSLPRINPN